MGLISSKYNFWNIVYEMLTRVVPTLTFAFSKIEIAELEKYREIPATSHSPVFIIGVPRTGSTFTYQMITNRYKVRYFDNIVDVMHQFPLAGMRYSYRYYHDKAHNCFRSKNGHTFRYGLHCPSEAGNYWYRFFSRKSYDVIPADLSGEAKERLKQEVNAMIAIYNQPLVIKNLANSLRLQLIWELFPDAKIIVVDRNDVDTMKSIKRIRKQKGSRPGEFWSIYPSGLQGKTFKSEDELVAAQIQSVKQIIDEDIRLFPKENVMRVQYEKLIASTDEILQEMDLFINTDLREAALAPSIIQTKK
ncbi:MAG: sulfotransferase [Bacteroidota bacterium]